MKSKKNDMIIKDKFPKAFLFILSMAPFFIILGLMSMDIPIILDRDAKFIGWHQLWINTRLGWIIIVASIIIEFVVFKLFKIVCKQAADEEAEVIEEIKDKNFELITFVTSIFLPLISFQYNQLSHWIVTFIIVLLIGYIFCHFEGFYTNPTLALFGYRLYEVTLDNQRQGILKKGRQIVVITQEKLHKDDRIKCQRLTNLVSYAKKITIKHE